MTQTNTTTAGARTHKPDCHSIRFNKNHLCSCDAPPPMADGGMFDYTDEMREHDEYEAQQGDSDGLDTER